MADRPSALTSSFLRREAGDEYTLLYSRVVSYLRPDHTDAILQSASLLESMEKFELAVATAISLFGFQSGAALATVVGVPIEVPVMLLVVRWANASKGWCERGQRVRSRKEVG